MFEHQQSSQQRCKRSEVLYLKFCFYYCQCCSIEAKTVLMLHWVLPSGKKPKVAAMLLSCLPHEIQFPHWAKTQ